MKPLDVIDLAERLAVDYATWGYQQFPRVAESLGDPALLAEERRLRREQYRIATELERHVLAVMERCDQLRRAAKPVCDAEVSQ